MYLLEILKTNTKTLCPQGSQGCQKKRHYPLNKLMEVRCAKIEPKMQKIFKTVRKHFFFSILTIFRSFLNSGSILAQKLNNFICKKKSDYWHPWDPWGRVHIDLNKNSVCKVNPILIIPQTSTPIWHDLFVMHLIPFKSRCW